MSTYRTFARRGFGEYKEKGSRFLGYAFPLSDVDAVKDCLREIKSQHPKARHHCYAYKLGVDNVRFRANDDGEPSGTAGKPMLGQLDSFGVTNALVVVARYFGGLLLGASGLAHAYKMAARAALDDAGVVEKEITFAYMLTVQAAQLPAVMTLLKKAQIETTSPTFADAYQLQIRLPESVRLLMLERLHALCDGVEAT